MNVSQGSLIQTTATIANSATDSSAIATQGLSLCGIYMPATFTGTALTFKACNTVDGTYVSVVDKTGSAISYTVSTSKYVAVDPTQFQGMLFLKIVSGSTEGGIRSLVCSMKGI